jgi:hypothetical protein
LSLNERMISIIKFGDSILPLGLKH